MARTEVKSLRTGTGQRQSTCAAALRLGTVFLGSDLGNQKTDRVYLSSVVLCIQPLIQRFVKRYFTKDL